MRYTPRLTTLCHPGAVGRQIARENPGDVHGQGWQAAQEGPPQARGPCGAITHAPCGSPSGRTCPHVDGPSLCVVSLGRISHTTGMVRSPRSRRARTFPHTTSGQSTTHTAHKPTFCDSPEHSQDTLTLLPLFQGIFRMSLSFSRGPRRATPRTRIGRATSISSRTSATIKRRLRTRTKTG